MSRLADVNQPIVSRLGILTNSMRLFLNVLQRIIDIDIALPYRFERFDSLILLNDRYPNPQPDQSAMVTGQGLAIYKGSASAWVLASDDTTLIT